MVNRTRGPETGAAAKNTDDMAINWPVTQLVPETGYIAILSVRHPRVKRGVSPSTRREARKRASGCGVAALDDEDRSETMGGREKEWGRSGAGKRSP
jgi:hypothetical protein